MEKQDYGRRFVPEIGTIYLNRCGSEYICTELRDGYDAIMERTTDKWSLVAHGITLYADGTITWEHSTGGHWPR